MTIQRYTFRIEDASANFVIDEPADNGRWVRYEDYMAKIDRLIKERDEARRYAHILAEGHCRDGDPPPRYIVHAALDYPKTEETK